MLRHLTLAFVTTALTTGSAMAYDTKAKQALLVDYDSGSILLAKEANTAMAPSSISKLMTVYMVFERLKEGSL